MHNAAVHKKDSRIIPAKYYSVKAGCRKFTVQAWVISSQQLLKLTLMLYDSCGCYRQSC